MPRATGDTTADSGVQIGTPDADDAAAISALALRSKGYWGYDDAFLRACRDELTYTADDCASGDLFVARAGSGLAGFGAVRGTGTAGELSALFVDPPWIGRGVGARLLHHAFGLARSRGITRMLLDADPGAEPFYLRFGAVRVGTTPSGSIPGRRLPRLQFRLDAG